MLKLVPAHALPNGVPSVKVEPTGNWSLPLITVVAPAVPPGLLSVSFTASMMARVTGAVLFVGSVSLVALVVPVRVTDTGVVSVPPAVPGVT